MRRHKRVIGKSGAYNWSTIIADADKVGIAQKYCDHIVGVSLNPAGYVCEIGLDRTNVEKIARSMAARDGAGGSIVMCLGFEHSDAVI